MSRSTQYIGLNNYALEFIKGAIKKKEIQIAVGMFDEPIIGYIYYMTPAKPNKEIFYTEVVQDMPWSSGPMVFTCLEQTLVKECGQRLIDTECLFFKWMIDPNLAQENLEYDIRTGRYYV